MNCIEKSPWKTGRGVRYFPSVRDAGGGGGGGENPNVILIGNFALLFLRYRINLRTNI